MYISEIFYSIQGEGELTGVPSVFIRTSGCNLRCSWCDTKYSSWYPEGKQMTMGEILDEVNQHNCDHVVLTGGEPMVARDIHELANRLKGQGKHITIETAATIMPQGIKCDLASLSPKLSNSTPDGREREKHERLRLQPEVIYEWINWYNYQLKFVISSKEDLQEIMDLLVSTKAFEVIEREKIMLMPEGTNVDTLRSRSKMVSDICKDYGWRYCQRLQIDLYGNTRGT